MRGGGDTGAQTSVPLLAKLKLLLEVIVMGEYPLIEFKSKIEDMVNIIQTRLPDDIEIVGKEYSINGRMQNEEYLSSLTLKLDSAFIPDIVLEKMLSTDLATTDKDVQIKKQFVSSDDPVTKISVIYYD